MIDYILCNYPAVCPPPYGHVDHSSTFKNPGRERGNDFRVSHVIRTGDTVIIDVCERKEREGKKSSVTTLNNTGRGSRWGMRVRVGIIRIVLIIRGCRLSVNNKKLSEFIHPSSYSSSYRCGLRYTVHNILSSWINWLMYSAAYRWGHRCTWPTNFAHRWSTSMWEGGRQTRTMKVLRRWRSTIVNSLACEISRGWRRRFLVPPRHHTREDRVVSQRPMTSNHLRNNTDSMTWASKFRHLHTRALFFNTCH